MKLTAVLTVLLLSAASAFVQTELDLSRFGVIGGFAVRDGIFYAAVQEDGADSSLGCGIFALDTYSREDIWFFGSSEIDEWDDQALWELQFHDGRLYAAIHSVGLLCLDAETGEKEFLWETGGTIIAPIIIEDGTLYTASKTKLVAMDAATGEIFWTFVDEPGEMGMVPTMIDLYLNNGRIYVGSIASSIRCFDAATGEYLWTSESVVDTHGGGYAHTNYVSDSLVFTEVAGHDITMLDAESGRMVSFIEGCQFLAGDEEGVYVFVFTEGICELDPESGLLTGRPGPYADLSIYDSYADLTDDLLCLGCDHGEIWIIPRSESVQMEEEAMIQSLSDEQIWATAQDGMVYAISRDSYFLSLDTRTGNTAGYRTGFNAHWPITIENDRGYFPSGSHLIIIHLVERKSQ